MNDTVHFEKTLSSETLFEGRVITLTKDTALLENGKTATREVVHHHGGACILPYFADGTICMVRQFRYAMQQQLWELPAGKLEKGEDPFEAAKRELEEECGLTADNYISLGEFYPTVGYDTEVIYTWVATGLHETKMHLDADEFLTPDRVPLEKAYQMVMSGEIRDGKTIETLHKGVDDFSEDRIIRGMVGREISDRFPKRSGVTIGDVCMEVKDWTVFHPVYRDKKVVDNVSMYVRKGEVVGISGLMGAGRTELAMSLFGHSYGHTAHGTLTLGGKEVKLKNEKDAIRHGLAYVTEDRKGNGLILSNPIRVNTTLANLEGVCHRCVVDQDMEYAVSDDYRKKLKTKCTGVEQDVGNLSGGNQQKVLLAKWMFADPDILILDEPTRGIDVGAKYEIYCIINELVASGKSVIMISSELPEVLGMSDRIYVMNEGRIVGEFQQGEASQESIMACILKSSNN